MSTALLPASSVGKFCVEGRSVSTLARGPLFIVRAEMFDKPEWLLLTVRHGSEMESRDSVGKQLVYRRLKELIRRREKLRELYYTDRWCTQFVEWDLIHTSVYILCILCVRARFLCHRYRYIKNGSTNERNNIRRILLGSLDGGPVMFSRITGCFRRLLNCKNNNYDYDKCPLEVRMNTNRVYGNLCHQRLAGGKDSHTLYSYSYGLRHGVPCFHIRKSSAD